MGGNIVGKGENAGFQHFLLFPQCWFPAFSPFPTMLLKGFFLRVVKCWDCVVELNRYPTQSLLLTSLRKKTFENIVRNGENAGKPGFLPFPQCFPPYERQISCLSNISFVTCKLIGECNTILSTYTRYRHLV